jgi:hypothetical protein
MLAGFKRPNFGGAVSNLYWLTEDQMARLRPFVPQSHGTPRADDRRPNWNYIHQSQWLARV